MTTIATDGYEIACDGRVTFGSQPIYNSKAKLFKIGNHIIGGCGIEDLCLEYVKWRAKGSPEDERPQMQEFTGIHLTKKGVFIVNAPYFNLQKADKVLAIGSGADFAVGAMAYGASPREAVKIAMKYDTGTGGRITVLSLDDL